MQNSYKSISRVWSEFPDEFNNLSLCDNKIKLKNSFEDKKFYFDDYITKIVLIGDVATGKSTLINALLGKEYFAMFSANGTVAFFYCSQTEKNYEYFTINDDEEVGDIDLLKNTDGLNVSFRDFIDQDTIFKVYIKNNVSRLLQNKTVIVDCPGFDHSVECDERINFHCSTADIILFIFDYKSRATPKQIYTIKEIRKQIRNPKCLFVYNKCDEIEFNKQKLESLEDEFNNTFNDQYHNGSKLYFVSALEPNSGKGFNELKTDILNHRNVNYIRYLNVRSLLSKAIDAFKENLEIFISSQKREKTVLVENLNQMTNQSNALHKDYSDILDFLRNIIDDEANFNQEKLFNVIFMNVKNYDGTCTKHDAHPFISKLANYIDKLIYEQLIIPLENRIISKIKSKFEDIRKEQSNEIDIVENKLFKKDDFFQFMITDMKLNIFWPHEKGCKTKKVKKAYIKFLKTKNINEKIAENISRFYNDHLSRIHATFVQSIELSKGKNFGKIKKLREDLKNKENIIELLEKYETNVKAFIQDYKVSLC